MKLRRASGLRPGSALRPFHLAALVLSGLLAFPASGAEPATSARLADCGEPAQCLAQVAKARGGMREMHGKFRQTKRVAMLREPLVSTGTFAMGQPNRLRWEVLTPEPFLLQAQGGVMRAGRPGQLQEVKDVPGAALSEVGGLLAGDPSSIGTRFTVKAGGGPGRFVLVPRDPTLARALEAIELALDVQSGVPRRVVLREVGGDSSEIEFMDVVLEREQGAAKPAS